MTAAARKLYMSQPSVSQAVNELEKHYSAKLFRRESGKLVITSHGKALFEQCERVLPIFNQAEETMFRLSQTPVVNVGASATVGSYVLPLLIARFKRDMPNVLVYTYVGNTSSVVRRLLDGSLGIGFVEGYTDNPNITKIPFMEDKLVAICNETHEFAKRDKLKLEDLSGVPVVLREKGSGTREQFEQAMRDKKLVMNVVGEHSSSDSIISYIACNQAVGVVSAKFQNIMPRHQLIKVFEIDDQHFTRIFSIVYHSDIIITPELSALIDLAKSHGF